MSDADKQYQKLVEASFKAAGLPEVDEKDLETGTYTNAQIAEKLRGNPMKLVQLLMSLDAMGGDVATKRSILSFAVDMPD
jgi:hypothetical protein